MNILFMGLMYNPSEENELLGYSKSGLGIASNILQQNLLKSLNLVKYNSLSCLTSLPVGSYPNNNKKTFYSSKLYEVENICVQEIKTINLPYIKHALRKIDFKKEINRWYELNQSTGEMKIIIYDLYSVFLDLTAWVKEKYPEIEIIIMIPDLVGNLRNKTSGSKIVQNLSNLSTKNVFKKLNLADKYIPLTEQMMKFVDDKNKPYLLVNGIVDDGKKYNANPSVRDSKTIFMYSGLLSRQYEVDKMVDTFEKIDNDKVELWLCGYGELSEELTNMQYRNTKYFGVLPKEKVREMEEQATVLINPRPNKGEYVKYSFPSKNLEYLLSGKPVVCFKLDGISNDYDEVFDYITNNESDLEKIINYYIDLTDQEIAAIGERNRRFVLKNNGYKSLANKLELFLKE